MNCHERTADSVAFGRRLFLCLPVSFSLALFAGCSLTGGKRDGGHLDVTPADDYGLREATKKLIVKIDNMEFLREDKKKNPESAICFLGITDSSGNQIPHII